MSKKTARLNELRYSFSLSCCGHTYSWPGLPNERADYLCRHCGKKMKPTVGEVRSAEAAELIFKHEKRFAEPCAECGRVHGHHVVQKGEAFFLLCFHCGEELRELRKEELE